MIKFTAIFLLMLFSIVGVSQENEPIVQVREFFKNTKNQYQVNYTIWNNLKCITYEVKLILYDNQNNVIQAYKLSGDLINVPGNTTQSIYWDVFKDRDDFPTVEKAEIKIIKTHNPLAKVLINTIPSGAKVSFLDYYNDIISTGTSPLNIEVKEGRYRIQVEDYGFEEQHGVVSVYPCNNEFNYTLKKLKYNFYVESKPSGASISIDGDYKSSTSANLSLPYGEHKLILEKHGFMKRKRALTLDSTYLKKKYFLKPNKIVGIGCIGGQNTLGGELLFIFSRVELDLSIMNLTPTIEIPYNNYSSLGYSLMLGYRIPYPIDFSIHAGLGGSIISDKDNTSNSKEYYSLVTGITLPIYFTPGFGVYLKADYWLNPVTADNFLFSGGLIWRY